MRRGAIVAVAALVLALVAPSPSRAQDAKTAPVAELRNLLKARTDAYRNKSRAAFEQTIDPQAPPSFREAQLRGFDGLVSLPIERIAFTIEADEPDLARGVDKKEYTGAQDVALVATTRTLRFTYDARSAIDPLFWTFVQRDGNWYVGGDDDLVDIGLESAVSMWDTGPVVVEQSEHFQLIAHPAQQARARELLGLAEQAIAVLGPRWTLPWSQKLVGFLPSSPDELADLIEASVDVTKYVAFVAYAYDPDTLVGTAPRLYVQDANLSQYSPAGQVETLVHELVHAAGSAYTGVFVPAWVHEGLADWVATGPTNRFPRGSGAGTQAPRDDEFGAGSQGSIVRAYRDARSLIATLSRVANPQAPYEFFKTLGSYKVRPGGIPHAVNDALRSVGATDKTTLEQAWVAGR